MKLIVVLALVALAVPAASTPALAGDPHQHAMKTKSGWFDMENCAFCQNMVKNPDLLEHLVWENHVIANGSLSITIVEPAYAAAYAEAMGAMMALGQKMHSGELDPTKVKMCGHCKAYGELMMAGANVQEVDGEAADVTLITSSDPQIIANIHEFTNRTNQEMGELMAAGNVH
jgi:hypothetical protein